MHFDPKIIPNLFDAEDRVEILALLESGTPIKSWKDKSSSRLVKKYSELDEHFSRKLEPIAREIFNDPSLKTTYSVYLDYNQPTSNLEQHRDTNACTYTINYAVSSRTIWPLIIDDQEFIIEPGQGLAFMGGFDKHGRGPMPDPDTNRVESIMFHFCPSDHWYFTEGPDYIYYLSDSGLLKDGDSYELSPKYIEKLNQK